MNHDTRNSKERRSRPSKLKRRRKNNGISQGSTSSTSETPSYKTLRNASSRPTTTDLKGGALTDTTSHIGIGSTTSQEEEYHSFASPCQILNISSRDADQQWRINCAFGRVNTFLSEKGTNNNTPESDDEIVAMSVTHDILGKIKVGYFSHNHHISDGVKGMSNSNGALSVTKLGIETHGQEMFFLRTHPYHRGDGCLIDHQSLVFPSMKEWNKQHDWNEWEDAIHHPERQMNATEKNNSISIGDSSSRSQTRGTLKIISHHAATIRQDYDIHDSIDSKCIGKLSFGKIRTFSQRKWLPPPSSESCEEEEEDDLCGVYRYQIQLLQEDCNGNNKGHGWISDRSRLKEDPYQIIQVLDYC